MDFLKEKNDNKMWKKCKICRKPAKVWIGNGW